MTEDGDQRILCWHFLPADGRLANGDGRKVVVGGTLSVEGKIKLQDRHSNGWGLHGSWRILDALGYASGPCVERCEVWGDVAWGVDQLAGRHRRTLAMADASDVLHHFACDWAERALWGVALQTGRAPDPRSLAAIETKRRWLRGEATDEELAGAARLAVRAAANVADCDAAWATYAVAYAARGVVYTAHATRGVAYTARESAKPLQDGLEHIVPLKRS